MIRQIQFCVAAACLAAVSFASHADAGDNRSRQISPSVNRMQVLPGGFSGFDSRLTGWGSPFGRGYGGYDGSGVAGWPGLGRGTGWGLGTGGGFGGHRTCPSPIGPRYPWPPLPPFPNGGPYGRIPGPFVPPIR